MINKYKESIIDIERGNSIIGLAPRLLYDIFIIDIPTVLENDLENIIRSRLRYIYPGDLNKCIIDFSVVGKNTNKCLIHLMTKENFEYIRSKKYKIISSTTLFLSKNINEKTYYGIWIDNNWMEICFIENDNIKWSRLIVYSNNNEIMNIVNALESNIENSIIYYCCIINTNNKLKDELIKCYSNIIFYNKEEIFNKIRKRKMDVLFENKNRLRFEKIINYIIIFLIFISFSLLPMRLAYKKSRHLKSINMESDIYEKSNKKRSEMFERLQILEKKYLNMSSTEYGIVYRYFNDLYNSIGKNIVIRNITINGSEFVFEAEGVDALDVIKNMIDSGLFEYVELQQSVILSQEKFGITGRFINEE